MELTLGILVSAGLLRFGPSFENIAWSTMFLIAPFGCIYYPIDILPDIFQKIAYGMPLVYVFEEARRILVDQSVLWKIYNMAFIINIIYLSIAISLFYYSFNQARKKDINKYWRIMARPQGVEPEPPEPKSGALSSWATSALCINIIIYEKYH